VGRSKPVWTIFITSIYLFIALFATVTDALGKGDAILGYDLKSWPEYILRGVNINIDRGQAKEREDFKILARDWGANHVRIQMFTAGVPLEFGTKEGSVFEYLKHKVDPVLEWCMEFNLMAVLDAHGAPGNPNHWTEPERELWKDFKWHDNFANLWQEIARYYRDNKIIAAYELLNEPNMRKQVVNTPSDWNLLAKKLTNAIREVDTYHTIMVGPIAWSSANGFIDLEPTGDPNTIYTFHMYQPHQFTHQGVRNDQLGIHYPGIVGNRMWNKEALREAMKSAIEFQKKHSLSRLYVGEFSAIIWAPDKSAYNYLRDLLELYHEEGWDWAYHAYREWQGWSLEHTATDRRNIKKADLTDRLELFKTYFAKNKKSHQVNDLMAK
jgi:aryl-phospho-beta-D-glucosidase BglC (GH1 family)